MLSKLYNKQLSRRITEWFHAEREDGGSPAETCMEVADHFLTLVSTKKLNISIPEKEFRRCLCEALCTMKRLGVEEWKGPYRQFPYPDEWCPEFETLWQSWLHMRGFTRGVWSAFWKQSPVREWETSLPGWRYQIETIVLYYVRRSMDVLVADGLLIEDDQGGFLDSTCCDEDDWFRA